MTVSAAPPEPTTPPARAADPPARRRYRRMMTSAAFFAFGLIVVGGIVRITGSGLGCGDDWPKCNGEWIPAFTFTTLIEYAHRLLALLLSLLVLAILLYALRHRATPGFGGRGGLLRVAALAAPLLLVQALLGAITVKLHLSEAMTAIHLIMAMVLMATLFIGAARAGAFGYDTVTRAADRTAGAFHRSALAAAALALLAVSLGALTANIGAPPSGRPSAAALACQGFPLCNGRLLPGGASLVHVQWTHRLVAYLLVLHVLAATIMIWRRNGPAALARVAGVTVALVLAQVGVAAYMVLFYLPADGRALHLLLGTAVWAATVIWTVLARRLEKPVS